MNAINQPTFIISVVNSVRHKIKREITDHEENLIIKCIKSVPQKFFNQYTQSEIIDTITKTVISELQLNQSRNNVDIHEMLKMNLTDETNYDDDGIKRDISNNASINIESIFGLTNVADVVEKVKNPNKSVNTSYLLLDTRHRVIENDGTDYFKWNHINSVTMAQGTINSTDSIRNILSIKMMQFRLPLVEGVDNVYKRITVLIHELSSQSIIAHEDRRFHFMCMLNKDNPSPGWTELSADDHSKGEFKFNKLITNLDTITISFGSPISLIKFDTDRLNGKITYGNPTIIEFPANHNLNTNDIVYISDFTTINRNGDFELINAINKTKGLVATVILNNTISVPIDTSLIITPLTGALNSPNVLLVGNITLTANSSIVSGVGTMFMVDLQVGDYIRPLNTNEIFQVKEIVNNSSLVITTFPNISGAFQYLLTSKKIIGVGTLFKTELKSGDRILINDGNMSEYIVYSIESDTELTITKPYKGPDGIGFIFSKDNSVDNLYEVYFGSKRIFIMLEITYLPQL